jgi:hypothetical protein
MTAYLIRNTVNDRCYVGKTTQGVGRRWIAEGMRSYWAEKKEAARESQEAA